MAFSYTLSVGISLVLLLLLRVLVRKIRAHSISHLPGPLPGPWLVGVLYIFEKRICVNCSRPGNLPELLRPDNIADAEFAWTRKYGSAVKIKGAFGVCFLVLIGAGSLLMLLATVGECLVFWRPQSTSFISNSSIASKEHEQVIQYILNTAGYNFHTAKHVRAGNKISMGDGILSAEGTFSFQYHLCGRTVHSCLSGAHHKRHRKIMNPAFSFGVLREFLPLFSRTSQRVYSLYPSHITIAHFHVDYSQAGRENISERRNTNRH